MKTETVVTLLLIATAICHGETNLAFTPPKAEAAVAIDASDPMAFALTFHEEARFSRGDGAASITNVVAAVDEVSTAASGLKDFQDIATAFNSGELISYFLIDFKVRQDCALVLVLYNMKSGRPRDPEALRLIRQNGTWALLPHGVSLDKLTGPQHREFRLLYEWERKAWAEYFAKRGIVP